MFPAIAIGAAVVGIGGAFYALFHKATPAPSPVDSLTITGGTPTQQIIQIRLNEKNMSDALARAVQTANAIETDLSELRTFGSALLPEFPQSSKLLMTKNPAPSTEVGTVFEDISDAFSSAWDAVRKVPGLGDLIDLVPPVLLHILAVATMTELLTALPGIGMQIGNTLATLGPVANDMLPGLARGERVDRVFIASVKSVASRAAAAGGADAAAEITGPLTQQGLSTLKDGMAQAGITPEQLRAKMDELRVAAGLKTAEQVLPAAFQKQYDDFTRPYLDKLNVKNLAKIAGVPEDLMQTLVDGATGTTTYLTKFYKPDGTERTAADDAADAAKLTAQHIKDAADTKIRAAALQDANVSVSIDSSVLSPTGGTNVWQGPTPGDPIGHYVTKGGKYASAIEIFGGTRKDSSYGGKMAKVPFEYIVSRMATFIAQNRRPHENIPSVIQPLVNPGVSTVEFPGLGSHALVDTRPVQQLTPDVQKVVDDGIATGRAIAAANPTLSDGDKMKLAIFALSHTKAEIDAYTATLKKAAGIHGENSSPSFGVDLIVSPVLAQVKLNKSAAPGITVQSTAQMAASDATAPWNQLNWKGDPLILWDKPLQIPANSTASQSDANAVALIPNGAIVTIAGTVIKSKRPGIDDDFFPVTYGTMMGELARGYASARMLVKVPASHVMVDDDRYALRAKYVKKYNKA